MQQLNSRGLEISVFIDEKQFKKAIMYIKLNFYIGYVVPVQRYASTLW